MKTSTPSPVGPAGPTVRLIGITLQDEQGETMNWGIPTQVSSTLLHSAEVAILLMLGLQDIYSPSPILKSS